MHQSKRIINNKTELDRLEEFHEFDIFFNLTELDLLFYSLTNHTSIGTN